MKKLSVFTVIAALLCGAAGQTEAADLSAAVGRTGESSWVFRLSGQWDWTRYSWFESDTGRLTGYWDAGYTYWKGDDISSNHSVSFSPVFVYEFNGGTVKPYIEAGVGVALFSKTRIEDQRLGSSFQFEDRLGVGLRFHGQEVGLRAIHYSNAGIKSPNEGIETYTVHYRVSF